MVNIAAQGGGHGSTGGRFGGFHDHNFTFGRAEDIFKEFFGGRDPFRDFMFDDDDDDFGGFGGMGGFGNMGGFSNMGMG